MQLACYLYCRLQGAQAPIGNRLEKPDRRKPTKPRVFSVTVDTAAAGKASERDFFAA
jgi:hypothetical protein